MSSTEMPNPTVASELAVEDGLKQNALGAAGIVFLVISAAAPLSVLAGIGPLAVLIGGISAPLIYAIAGIVLAVFSVGFLYMARHVKVMGGFYTYISESLGKVVGLASGLLAWLSYNVLQIGLYGLVGVMGQGMFATLFGVDIPWYIVAIVAAGLVYLLAVAGVDVGAKVLGVLLVLETLLLAILAVAILVNHGATLSFATFAPENIFTPNMFAILGFGFGAYMGFESTVLYRNETRNPNRSIPRATYVAVAFLAVFYSVTLWIVIQAFGDAQVQAVIAEDPASFFFIAMAQNVGDWGVNVMFVLIVSSIFAGQLAFHNAINRYSYALARDGIIPNLFHRTNKNGAPWIAGLIQTIAAIVIVVLFAVANLDPLTQLVIWVNSPGVLGIIMLQVLASIAVFVFLRKNSGLERKWYVMPAAVFSIIAMITLFIVLISTIEYITASGPVINTIILLVVPIVLIVGALYALRLRSKKPEVFARIGGE